MVDITLEVLPHTFAVCQLPPDAVLDLRIPYVFWAQTPDERSLVCPQHAVPRSAEKVQKGLRCLRVTGVLNFSLIGIMSRLTTVLTEAGIPVFAVSTWNTDYLFVSEHQLRSAGQAFEQHGIPVHYPARSDRAEV